jgi:hypothetical protein
MVPSTHPKHQLSLSPFQPALLPPAGTPATLLKRPRDPSAVTELEAEPAQRPSPSPSQMTSLPMLGTPTPSPLRTPPPSPALTSQALAAAKRLNDALGKLPAVVMPSVCYKCAGKTHTAEQCSATSASNISQIMFRANCCARCALPLKRAGTINLHPGPPAAGCNGSLFFMSKLLIQPPATLYSVFQPQNFGLQLELLASFLPRQ